MQSELLDIVIIGCLVLLFASTYRKRTTAMVQFWTAGWVLILVHFTSLLFHPTSAPNQTIQEIVEISALIVCGVMFLLAAANKNDDQEPRRYLTMVTGSTGVYFVVLQACGVTVRWPYFIIVAIGAVCWVMYALRLRRVSVTVRSCLIVSTIASTIWLTWTIIHVRQDVGISAILSQVYLAVCLVYVGTFRRISGGTLTVVFGLLAWSAVFPVGEFCQHLGILSHISPELWNVPKYFVAFGMILTLLEEEIIAAKVASEQYRILFDANPHPMWIYDRNTLAFRGVNDAAVSQYGYSREEFLRMTLEDVSATTEGEPSSPFLDNAKGKGPIECIQQHRKSDGTLCAVDVATNPLRSEDGDLAFSLVQDVTERRELHNRLSHQAHHDLLTGLANRAWLEARLRETLLNSEHQNRRSALLCLDVDRFKQINDTYGHGVGDICLQELARRLTQLVRSTDIVARVGGEEFSLLLTEIANAENAEQIAAEILTVLKSPIEANSYSIELTGSIGIAIFPEDGRDATTLWRNADCAMYRAKRAGGNQYLCMSPEIGLITSEANAMEHCIRLALKTGGLEMHYQPLFGIDGELHSMEALVRLRHPRMGLVSPARFVPIAEESGLIVPLGNWVLNEVCRQSAAWQHEGLPSVRIAVNISSLQITRPDFASNAIEVLSSHGVDPHFIGMEITETAMMRNIGEAGRQIKALADMGVVFSIDDFGTGYSSLGQLDKLPVHSLKIDRTFVDRICRQNGTYSIVNAIISMAHSLRLEVVAEGVESHEQWTSLRQLGCDTVQGFLFSRPVPAADVPSLLRRDDRRSASLQREHEARVA